MTQRNGREASTLLDENGLIVGGSGDQHNKRDPMSTTKLWTFYTILKMMEKGELPSKSDPSDRSDFITRHQRDVMLMLVRSDNEAAKRVARAAAREAGEGKNFAYYMNREADENLNNAPETKPGERTHFVTFDGMNNPNHYSSAYHMAYMSYAMDRDFGPKSERDGLRAGLGWTSFLSQMRIDGRNKTAWYLVGDDGPCRFGKTGTGYGNWGNGNKLVDPKSKENDGEFAYTGALKNGGYCSVAGADSRGERDRILRSANAQMGRGERQPVPAEQIAQAPPAKAPSTDVAATEPPAKPSAQPKKPKAPMPVAASTAPAIEKPMPAPLPAATPLAQPSGVIPKEMVALLKSNYGLTEQPSRNSGTILVDKVGNGVKALQERLIAAGHPLPEHGADGKFGPETYAQFSAYAKEKNLNPNTALAELFTGAQTPQVAAAPTSPNTPIPAPLPIAPKPAPANPATQPVSSPAVEAAARRPLAAMGGDGSYQIASASGDWHLPTLASRTSPKSTPRSTAPNDDGKARWELYTVTGDPETKGLKSTRVTSKLYLVKIDPDGTRTVDRAVEFVSGGFSGNGVINGLNLSAAKDPAKYQNRLLVSEYPINFNHYASQKMRYDKQGQGGDWRMANGEVGWSIALESADNEKDFGNNRQLLRIHSGAGRMIANGKLPASQGCVKITDDDEARYLRDKLFALNEQGVAPKSLQILNRNLVGPDVVAFLERGNKREEPLTVSLTKEEKVADLGNFPTQWPSGKASRPNETARV